VKNEEEDEDNLKPSPEIAEKILKNAEKLDPRIQNPVILGHQIGLRPGRVPVRLEIERISQRCTILHNYGHGGAGFTLSWGVAEDALTLVNQM